MWNTKFSNGVPKKKEKIKRASISMEICSEAPGYKEDWKSDLTLWVNDVEVGTWTCPGDFRGQKRTIESPGLAKMEAHSMGCRWSGRSGQTAVI